MSELRTVNVTRYVTPLREGGSLPAIVEADDDGMYVLKFSGAGQGPKALIAELISGELARHLGLRVPEIVLATLDGELARTEPDPEIQDLLKSSAGLNIGLDYLPGSITFDPVVDTVEAALASRVVWFDSFVTNVDRTPRNANMLMWHRDLWLIDQGASLYFQHSWDQWKEQSIKPFSQIRDHILLPFASELASAHEEFRSKIDDDTVASIIRSIPDAWLDNPNVGAEESRSVYTNYLSNRVENSEIFLKEALRAREALV